MKNGILFITLTGILLFGVACATEGNLEFEETASALALDEGEIALAEGESALAEGESALAEGESALAASEFSSEVGLDQAPTTVAATSAVQEEKVPETGVGVPGDEPVITRQTSDGATIDHPNTGAQDEPAGAQPPQTTSPMGQLFVPVPETIIAEQVSVLVVEPAQMDANLSEGYLAGHPIMIQVINGLDQTIYAHDLKTDCTTVILQSQEGSEWQDIQGCGMEILPASVAIEPNIGLEVTLNPFSTNFGLELGATEPAFDAGAYRIKYSYAFAPGPDVAEQQVAYSEPFTIAAE